MAKIRAYKIAEELGLDRNDLVERAKSLGIEVPGPMASLDEDIAALLRERLGGHAPGAQITERRVEGQGGGAVIRRRKRAPEPAPPAPTPQRVEAPSVEVAPEPEPTRESHPIADVTSVETGEAVSAEPESFAVESAAAEVEAPRPSRPQRRCPGEPPREAVRAERSIARPISVRRPRHRARARSASAYAKW
jgi:hypothetical protein